VTDTYVLWLLYDFRSLSYFSKYNSKCDMIYVCRFVLETTTSYKLTFFIVSSIRLLLFYSIIFQSIIFESCKFQSPLAGKRGSTSKGKEGKRGKEEEGRGRKGKGREREKERWTTPRFWDGYRPIMQICWFAGDCDCKGFGLIENLDCNQCPSLYGCFVCCLFSFGGKSVLILSVHNMLIFVNQC